MSLIDRAATFRGRIADHGISKTKNGYPQWVAQLVAQEIYDSEEQVWVDWSQYDVNEITAFLVLFGGKGETLTCQQVKKVTGWDGLSFQSLSVLNLSEIGIQFRVEENEYDGKTSLQVAWVDVYDAEPGRVVRKLDSDDLKALDAQYSRFLKQSATKVAPVKAATTPAVKAKGIKPTQPKGPVKKVAKDPLGPPNPPSTPPDPNTPAGRCSKAEAWATACELKAKKFTDEQLANTWLDALNEVAPKTEQENVTDEQWFLVREKVLAKTAIF